MNPHVWMHKETGELLLVTPWFLVKPDASWNADYEVTGYSIGLTAVTRVGWLINNKHDMWLGANDSAADYFEDLGEL